MADAAPDWALNWAYFCFPPFKMLERLEYIHSKHFIHRDIKPDNFLMGPPGREHIVRLLELWSVTQELMSSPSPRFCSPFQVYIIDFGLAKRYRDPKTAKHIAFRQDKHLTGACRGVEEFWKIRVTACDLPSEHGLPHSQVPPAMRASTPIWAWNSRDATTLRPWAMCWSTSCEGA